MSDPTAPYQPPLASNVMPPKPSSRPTSITVFGILNLVFAAMGLFGTCFATIPIFILNRISSELPQSPVFEVLQESQGYFIFMIFSLVMSLLAVVVLAFAGVGLLKMQSWGRTLSIAYAIFAILHVIAGTIANVVWLLGPLMERASGPNAGPEAAGAVGGMIGGTFGSCFGLIYPVVLLIFMFRPTVVSALRSEG